MGLWEWIKRKLGTTDEGMAKSVSYEAHTVGGEMLNSGKRWPYKQIFASADGRVPPGCNLTKSLQFCWPYVYGSAGDYLKVALYDGATGGTDQAAAIASNTSYTSNCQRYGNSRPMIAANQAHLLASTPILKYVESTLVNGALANVVLVVANAAAYYGVIRIINVMMDVAPAGANLGLTFQTEDDVALTGPIGGVATIQPVAYTVNTQLNGTIYYTTTDQKALEVDYDTGGGAPDDGKKVGILFEYWYET